MQLWFEPSEYTVTQFIWHDRPQKHHFGRYVPHASCNSADSPSTHSIHSVLLLFFLLSLPSLFSLSMPSLCLLSLSLCSLFAFSLFSFASFFIYSLPYSQLFILSLPSLSLFLYSIIELSPSSLLYLCSPSFYLPHVLVFYFFHKNNHVGRQWSSNHVLHTY